MNALANLKINSVDPLKGAAIIGTPLTQRDFSQFQKLIYDIAGIHLAPVKSVLVAGRLARRLKACGLSSYSQYLKVIQSPEGSQELQNAIDLLTTHETYFFREQKHFDFLMQKALPERDASKPFRVWSSACSSGEETYSIAMTLAEHLTGKEWEVFGSDISAHEVETARQGRYGLSRTEGIPCSYLKKYCLKGLGDQDGTLLIDSRLRSRVKFSQINLNEAIPSLGVFDVIFLRNVMIYFSPEVKRKTVAKLMPFLKPGGYLFIGHSESLNGFHSGLEAVAPAIYRKP